MTPEQARDSIPVIEPETSDISPSPSSTSSPDTANALAERDCLAGGSNMGALMRSYDWSSHRLGTVAKWPQSLCTATSICLESRFPILIWWGREMFMLYNDAYASILGAKHPGAMGQAGAECWPEIWDMIGPMLEGVLKEGQATWSEDQLLLLDRNGYVEECYFTFSYSPIRSESGHIGGIFTAVTETTEKILGERRLTALQELGAASAQSERAEEACELAAAALSNYAYDIPFGLIYLIEPDRSSARLVGRINLNDSAEVAPPTILLQAGQASPWRLETVLSTNHPVVLNLTGSLSHLPGGPWPENAKNAVVLPIASAGENQATGVLIAGISPRRAFDDRYRAFFDLLTRNLAAVIADARAYEDQQKRADSLAELDRAKTAFFSNVSHEFRTPLTLILGPLEDALSSVSTSLTSHDRERLTVVHRNALRLLKLVNSLLDFSRIEAGRVEAIYQPTDLAAFTGELASSFRSAMERAGLQFEVACPPIAEPIYVERDMWEKIVLNLLSNAFKFTLSGSVSLRLRSEADSVQLEVKDTGIGIPTHELPHLFERFHRVEGAQGRTHEGTGIGLALVQELVKLHRGSISVTSDEGHGSKFLVTIPRGKDHLPQDRLDAARTLSSSAVRADSYVEEALRWLPDAAAGSSAINSVVVDRPLGGAGRESAESDADGSLIVLADDNADMRDYLQRLLGERYRVHAVANGEEAVKATRELHPDLVLTDVLMPSLDGFGVLHALKSDAETKSTPVILLSARAGEESRVEGLQAGADDYLVKPFTARELMARVGAHLRLAKVRAEAAEVERRLRSEADLERRRLRESFILAPAAMAVLRGPEHRFTFVNSAYVELVGVEHADQLIGKTVLEAFPEVKDQGYIALLDGVFQTGEPFLASEAEVRLTRKNATDPLYVTFSYQAMSNVAGEVEGVLVHALDVTEQVQARSLLEARVKERTSDLQDAEHKLRALNSRLLQAQDDERRRLARDLHDSAGQILVALKMNLFPLHQELEKQNPALAGIASSSVELVDELSKQLRTMSHLLHPPLLDEAGLPSALRWYVEGFAERSGIAVDLQLDPNLPRLPQESETAIFRIVQECLTNIHRHSGSCTASVRLDHDGGKTRVEISDTGKGISNFDPKKKVPKRVGVGIQGMQERVRQLEGNFEISSGASGTSVVVTLPN